MKTDDLTQESGVMKTDDLTQEQLDAFCRELSELLTKHKVTIDPCHCGEVLQIRGWDGTMTCTVRSDSLHDQTLQIDES